MGKEHIKMPDMLGDCHILYNYIQSGEINKLPEVVDLDFRKCKMSNWNSAIEVILIIFIGKLFQLKKKITYQPPEDEVLRDYIQNSNFRSFIKEYEKQTDFLNADSQSVNRYLRIEGENISAFISSFCGELSITYPNIDFSIISSILGEVMNNVYDHSEDDFGAYMSWNITDDRLDITIGDCGKGIPYKVFEYFKKNEFPDCPIHASGALEWALAMNNTTKSTPRNRGKGLDIVFSGIKNTPKAHLSIHTGPVSFHWAPRTDGSERYNIGSCLIDDFKGTLVRIVLVINQLPENDSVEDLSVF